MLYGNYVIYQSAKAAADMFHAMEILPDQMKLYGVHYINEETAEANLEMAELKIKINHLRG
ncbi:hypothetical protein [Clostridium sp. AM58-1XD]|uniref:hypothetical protein n=1 Tax=Clostridium sp. AM58-1XD TaxID=2292307 RepID=UPI000E48A552|nr:hypothetical protein [Clostridium sp. AM58-1XD]RGY97284.1 hypothetical protein DXA13_15200 [Clostridium sp. AM58-1XD]